MKKIKLNENIGFTKCRTKGFQKCSYCGDFIGEGNIGLSISKKCSNNLNVWIHINCIERFCGELIKFKKEKIKEIMLAQMENK